MSPLSLASRKSIYGEVYSASSGEVSGEISSFSPNFLYLLRTYNKLLVNFELLK